MNQNNRKTGGNMSSTFAIRCLAAVFVFYSLYDIVRAYFAGGEDAPSLLLLLLAILVLGGGGAFVAYSAYKEWKRDDSAQDETSGAEADEQAALPEETKETEQRV